MFNSDVRSFGTLLPAIVFIVVGLFPIGIGVMEWTTIAELRNRGLQAQGVVETVTSRREQTKNGSRTRYDATIVFSGVDARSHRIVVNENLSQGSHVRLLYLPTAPESARTEAGVSILRAGVPFGFGVIFSGVGLLIAYFVIRRQKEIRWLTSNGERIQARAVGVIESVKRRKSGGSSRSYRLVCEWRNPRSGELVQLKSEPRQQSPEHLVGQDIPAYIDSSNPKRYFVDVSK